ncbi:MAG: hypothetical protein H0X46_09010, partial [Bacteroidetes bacterium]|nr:hypothetical protein [Bacteroidota bacterium]
ISLDKKGAYTMTDVIDGVTYTSSGSWNFTSGVGDLKNKSQITLYEQSNSSPGSSNTYTGKYVDIAFDIDELRNKKMVWHSKITSTNSGTTISQEDKYVWEAK